MFVSVKLPVVVFPEGINNGVRGCEMLVSFSRNTVALAGVFTTVVFVGSTAPTKVVALAVRDKANITPKIAYWRFIMLNRFNHL
jgi:hypothetical protein